MEDKKNIVPLDHVIESSGDSQASENDGPRMSRSGVLLVPQPSTDARDPLVSALLASAANMKTRLTRYACRIGHSQRN